MSQNRFNKKQRKEAPSIRSCPGCKVNFSTRKAFSNHVPKCHAIKLKALDSFPSTNRKVSTLMSGTTNGNGITFREGLQALQQHNVPMNNLDIYQQQCNDRRIQYNALVTKMCPPGTETTGQQTLCDPDADTDTGVLAANSQITQEKDVNYAAEEEDEKEDDGGFMAAEEGIIDLGIGDALEMMMTPTWG